MDSTHLHLILNHFPIIGTLVATFIMAYGLFSRSMSTQKSALLAWTGMALLAIPVFLTGEPAEESVEGLAGVSEAIIGQHEEAAELAIWVMEALGLLSLLTFFTGFNRKKPRKLLVMATFSLSLITFGLMAYTGYLGGQIHHSEIRSGAVAQQNMEKGAEKDDD